MSAYYTEQAEIFARAMSESLGDIALSLEILDATRKGLSANSLKGPKVLHAVAKLYDVAPDRIARGTINEMVKCRWVAMMAMRLAGMSYPEIGRALGLHHTTCISGVRQGRKHPGLVAAADLIYAGLGK